MRALRERGILPIAYRALAYMPVAEMCAEMGDETQAALGALRDVLGADSAQQAALARVARAACDGYAWWLRRPVQVLCVTPTAGALSYVYTYMYMYTR